MVSRYMVLFGITYLRLDIFIAWWMNIFQSTVVLWHFVFQFVHRHILGYTPFSESIGHFSRLSFTFWSSCWPLRVAYWAIPPSLRALDLSTNFHSPFDLVVDPSELHTGAYSPSMGSSDLSQASLSFDLVADRHELSYWGISPPAKFVCIVILVILWLWATWSDQSSCQYEFEFSSWERTYIDRSFPCQFEFLRLYLYWPAIFL